MASLVDYRKEPTKIKGDYKETVMHVGCTGNKLDELKAVLEAQFDSIQKFKSANFGKKRDNTEYMLRGTKNGVKYIISIQHIECPLPISMAQIHHVSVKIPEGSEDVITPVIEQQLKKYQRELEQQVEKWDGSSVSRLGKDSRPRDSYPDDF